MKTIDEIEREFSQKISALNDDKEFFGTVNYIEKKDQTFVIHIDLFNQSTDAIDDVFLLNKKLRNITYSFDLIIETSMLSIFGHKNELFKFQIINQIENFYDTFEGTISLITNKKFDTVNPFHNVNKVFKVSKVTPDEKMEYKKRIEWISMTLENHYKVMEKYTITDHHKELNSNKGIVYSQYHVGLGNCSYINLGGISRGFFNLGYTHKKNGKKFPYLGFSRHKPNWIILSNLIKDNYNAAIRYGTQNTFSCVWILPNITKLNVNLIRLFYCIKNANGQIIILKYKANSSVCSYIKEDLKLEVFYTTDYDININGLSLYLEHKDNFISIGNSDYNFLTKSLIKQKFETIVIPYQGSKMKTKIHLKQEGTEKSKLIKNEHYLEFKEKFLRNGFHIHRTDLYGNYICRL